jgi:outer membrane receptor protein involved in Fe transport
VAFAVGAEHRDYTAIRDPDNLSQVPGELGGAGGAVLPIRGGYTAEDFFGELIVPVASDKPFMQELTLEAGIRYSKYKVDTIGDPKFNATTYKLGGTWQPIEALKFRANWQKAVRAPNIGELFAPVVTFLTNLATDPCAGQITNPAGPGYNAALATNINLRNVCIAQGAPVGAIGAIQNPAAAQSNATGGGNPLLTPETAKSYTLGVVINPRAWLPGFTATIDDYNIRVTDAITRPLPGDTIAACFGSATGAGVTAAAVTSPACLAIRRSTVNGRLSGSPATVAGLPAPLTNAGELYTDGVDLTMNYRRDVGFADLILNFAGNWTRTAKFWADPDSPNQLPPPNCPGVYSANCGIAVGQLQPEYSWNQRSTLSFKHVDVSLLWRHLSKFKYQSDLPPLCEPGLPAALNPTDAAGNPCTGVIIGGPFAGRTASFNRIPAYNYFDLTTRFNVTDHFELTLSAFNIFDKKAPIVGTNAGTTTANSGNTFPSTYDVLGRRYSATARIKF